MDELNYIERYILGIIHEESKEQGEVIRVNYKVLNSKYDLYKKGISYDSFRKYLSRLTKNGYLVRVKYGYYKLTEKGKLAVLDILLSQSGGTSPQSETPSSITTLQKLSEYYYGIRVHNIKAEVAVKFLSNPIPKEIKETFTVQFYTKKDDIGTYALIHYNVDILAKTPAEALTKLMKYTNQIFTILYTKYKVAPLLDTFNIKHWEWAYQFKLSEGMEEILEQVKNMVLQFGDKFNVKWDKSLGIFELETNDDFWALFFFLSPFLQVIEFKQINLLYGLLFDKYKDIDEIKKHAKEINSLKEFIINSFYTAVVKQSQIMEEFAKQIKLHLGAIQGLSGGVNALNGLIMSFVEYLAENREFLKKLNEKLDKL